MINIMDKQLIVLLSFIIISVLLNVFLLVFYRKNNKDMKTKKTPMAEPETEEQTNSTKEKEKYFNYVNYNEYINKDIIEEYAIYTDNDTTNIMYTLQQNTDSTKIMSEDNIITYDDTLYITFLTHSPDKNNNIRVNILVDDVLIHQNFIIKNQVVILKYKLKKPIKKVVFMISGDDVNKYTRMFRVDYNKILYKSDQIKSINTIIDNNFNDAGGIMHPNNDYVVNLL